MENDNNMKEHFYSEIKRFDHGYARSATASQFYSRNYSTLRVATSREQIPPRPRERVGFCWSKNSKVKPRDVTLRIKK